MTTAPPEPGIRCDLCSLHQFQCPACDTPFANIAADNARLVARVEELERLRDGTRESFLLWRGVDGEPCDRCSGSGTRSYGSTATWHGGAGGQMVTLDVCDCCWGSGDLERKGCNLRDMASELRRLLDSTQTSAENARLRAALDSIVTLANDSGHRDPWEVLTEAGMVAEMALRSDLVPGPDKPASSMWTTPVDPDRPPLENARLDPTVTREQLQEIARKAEASAFKPRPISDELLRMPLDGPPRSACPCCGARLSPC